MVGNGHAGTDNRFPAGAPFSWRSDPDPLSEGDGEIVFFEGAASGGTPPYSYTWTFGAGIPPSKKKIPGETHFYYEGVYNVRFTVTDSKGYEDTDSVRIVVQRKEMF